MSEIAHTFEIIIARLTGRTDTIEDFIAEFTEYSRVRGEFVEEPGESDGGGVAAGEEDGDELVAKDGAVASVGGDCMEEGVALVGFGEFFEFIRGEGEGLVDDAVGEFVEHCEAGIEGFLGDEGADGARSCDRGLDSAEGKEVS
jgi:hypothetical protein